MGLSERQRDIRQMARLAYWLSFAIVFLHLGQDYLLGGNTYRQGDWLINIEQVAVRRGLPGSAFIHLSDWLHVDLLWLVVLCQALMLTLFAAGLYRAVRQIDHQPLYWLLLFSPAFTLLFWSNDPQGSLRKELFAYAGFALLLAAIADRRRLGIAGAVLVFALGMLGHEANGLFLPTFVFLLFSVRRADLISARELRAALMVLLLVALTAAVFFFRQVSLRDAMPVCAPLLARGFDAGFCDGAIAWVTRDLSYAIRVTAGNWSIDSWAFLTVYLWTTAIACWFASHFRQARRLWLMYVATALPFLPLFYVALDWGRWMNFHLSSWIFLVLAEQALGRLQQHKPCDDKLAWVVTASILPLAPSHMTYLVMPSAALVILTVLMLGAVLQLALGRYRRSAGRDAGSGTASDAAG